MNKRWKFNSVDQEAASQLNKGLNVNPVFSELLIQRGIHNYEAARRFFRPGLEQLYDPFLMKDMDKAVDRILQAINQQEKVLVYGDYDVDGTTSVSLMMDFLSNFHLDLEFYIPDRHEEGYGLSTLGVEFAKGIGTELMIVLDCGTKDFDALEFAQMLGLDVLVVDHHLPDETLPPTFALLNPKQKDCPYPFKEHSACALAFKLVHAVAIRKEMDFKEYVQPLLDLVVLSLACDMVPLVDENRVLAYFGLRQFNEVPRLSLEVLRAHSKRQEIWNIKDLVFGIGPLLNAAGRMDHGREAAKMLLANNLEQAQNQVEYLALKNQERKAKEKEMMQEASAIIADNPVFQDQKSIVLYRPHWHQGLLGIVAAKLAEQYKKPTIIFTLNKNQLVGSARSIGTFNVHNAIANAQQLLLNFGGHQFAAGLSMKEEHFEDFVMAFEDFVYHQLTTEDELPILLIDAQLELKSIDDKFWNILRQFAPFGPSNPQPVFMSKQVKDTGYSKLIKEEHIKILVRQGDSSPIEGIAYGFGPQFEALSSRKPFHLCYAIEEQVFRGRRSLQLLVRDMKF